MLAKAINPYCIARGDKMQMKNYFYSDAEIKLTARIKSQWKAVFAKQLLLIKQ